MEMSKTAFCFRLILITYLKMAYPHEIQLQVNGSSALMREVHLQGTTLVSYGNFAAEKFHRLQVSVASSTVVSNYRECAISCVSTPPCSSFNVASSPNSDGRFGCELLNEDKFRSFHLLISSQKYHHYSIKVRTGTTTSFTENVKRSLEIRISVT